MIMPNKPLANRIHAFNLQPGEILVDKYRVVAFLGGGWEGEVYKIQELATGIDRTAKLFFPQRNPRNAAITSYAKKLHRLQHCEIVIHYHTTETINYQGASIVVLISEYVDGELLKEHLQRHRGKRLPIFQAVHLLHAMATGIDSIHQSGEYHGDLHSSNIIVQRLGMGYELKLLDLHNHGRTTREHLNIDICDLVHLFYQALGGQKHYAGHPPAIKHICCGLKRTLILKKFRRASDLCHHLEALDWSKL